MRVKLKVYGQRKSQLHNVQALLFFVGQREKTHKDGVV